MYAKANTISPATLVGSIIVLSTVLLAVVVMQAYTVLFYVPAQISQTRALVAGNTQSQVAGVALVASSANDVVAVKGTAISGRGADLAAVVKDWSSVVPHISCTFYNEDSSAAVGSESGSGLLVRGANGSVVVQTNRHVLAIEKNGTQIAARECTLSLPDSSSYTVSNHGGAIAVDNTTDFGTISISNPTEGLRSVAAKNITARACTKRASIGDSIVVLGYPTIGAENGITATEGIISGIEGAFYVTSAKVEHGDSGGIAINVKDSCYLGIPTFVKSGSLESLARILMWQATGTK